MKKRMVVSTASVFVLGFIIFNSGCGKKAAPPPVAKIIQPEPVPAVTPAQAPTISLSAEPSTISEGQSTVLRWRSTNATSVELDAGIGPVANSGQVTVVPTSSQTYTAKATGAGGSATASTRVTVEIPVKASTPPPLSDREFFEKHIRDVFFDYDQFNITDVQLPVVEGNVRSLKERPGLKLIIEGHCDERGSEKYNLALGDMRANAIKTYLVSHGISPARIETVSYGEERPFDPGHHEGGWSQNRRGHFILR